MPYLLGLGHKARQGKDTVGGFLAERGWVILHFADALKAQAEMYGWSPDEKNVLASDLFTRNIDTSLDQIKPECVPMKEAFCNDGIASALLSDIDANKIDGVTFLQWLGSFRRSQDQDYWVKITMRAAMEHLKQGRNVAICDMRYTNEADAISAVDHSIAFPFIVDVVRLVLPTAAPIALMAAQYIDPDRDPNHPSEVDLDDYEFDDVLVAYTGDIEGLRDETERLLEHMEVTTTLQNDEAGE